MINRNLNRIHYRIMNRKAAPATKKCPDFLPFAVCALGASAITAGIIASFNISHKKYLCPPKMWKF